MQNHTQRPRYTCRCPVTGDTCGKTHRSLSAAERCCSRDTEDGVNERVPVEITAEVAQQLAQAKAERTRWAAAWAAWQRGEVAS